MSRRKLLWRKKLGYPDMLDKNGKMIGRGSQCRGDKIKLQSGFDPDMKQEKRIRALTCDAKAS